ncbi:5-oxoprolinase subunit B family protein [Celeribacter halophilus]|uniref:5-oxoprolinase subunit B family protein n=1 Tax=Celeribacter halophilus TaxID=576117 RepID=UPI001C08E1B1|nr:carboxyltransferase domain-containing protein [Celeribacter halophilus]MBU2889361.1 allophanate hydrolase subunit 1 [Celeribacter halophilus]MDO6509401.1 carboxyltransferase domain-containing protein [Celeribacter halophilus]
MRGKPPEIAEEISRRPAGTGAPEILTLGRDGWLVRFALTLEPWVTAAVQKLHAQAQEAARSGALPGVTKVSPCLTSVLFSFDPASSERATVRAAIARLVEAEDWHTATPEPAARLWQVPVAFGGEHGPDLDEVATLSGRAAAQVIEDIAQTPLRVLAIGFAPGQPYLGLLPAPYDLPRMSALNPQVPQGAIALAVRQLVLFANASPTGWRQVARTAFRPFRPDSDTPIPLRAGDEMRLVPVSGAEMSALLSAGDPAGGARLEVRR